MLLAFDTSTPRVTVALSQGAQVLAEYEAAESMRHGELLGPGIAQVLGQAGARSADLTGIAVGVGPGPFTGLRVGLVTARTLAHALDLPILGICSLDILAAEAIDAGLEDFWVATDARRKEVYLAEFRGGHRVSGPEVVMPGLAATAQPVVGQGAQLYPDAFGHPAGPVFPSAAALCRLLAQDRFPVLDPEPLYLRRPDAVAGLSGKRVS